MTTRRFLSIWAKRVFLFGMLLSILAGCSGLSFGPTVEPVTVTFVYMENAANYEPLAQEFTRQHPNVTIKLDPVKLDMNFQRTLETKVGEADVVRLPTASISDEQVAGFLPLDSQVSTAQDFPQDDLFPGSLAALKLNGKQVGLPAGINPFVVFYSPGKFAAAGVQAPAPGWTLEDFVNKATAVNNTSDSLIGTPKYAWGFCSHPSFPDGALFTYLFGGGLFDSLTMVSRPTLNQRENVQALEWYAALRNDMGLVPNRERTRDIGEMVFRSSCGFWIDWLDRSNYGYRGPDDAVPLPMPSYQKSFNIAALDGYFIQSKTLHAEESWQWINFIMKQQSASGILIPPLKSEIASKEYAARASSAALAVAQSLPADMSVLGLEMFRNQRFSKVLELFATATTQVFNGEKTAQQALDAAQQQAEALFK